MARVQLHIANGPNRITLKALLEAEGHAVVSDGPEVFITDDVRNAPTLARSLPTLVLATAAQIPEAVAAMLKGVYGYVFVPFQPKEAGLMVSRAVGERPRASDDDSQSLLPLREVERRHIRAVLRRCNYNRARAARVLGIGRNSLWRKLKQIRDELPQDHPQTPEQRTD